MIQVELSRIIIDEKRQDQVIVLKEKVGDRQIPIVIGFMEASSIKIKISGVDVPRPMTHDLFISVLECLSASITNVLIDDLDAGIYYARLTIKSESRQSEIDARPSDCLALALRSRAPIEVQEKVVRESSISKSDVEKLVSIDNYLQ